MGPPMKKAADRASSNITVAMPADELDVLNAYCAAKGWSRTYVLRRLIRLLSIKDLSPEASLFRRLQAELPALEDQ